VGRNYDQLVAAAKRTGTFQEYVGDGASVPWQCFAQFNPPLGFTLWTYKAFLDAAWPDGFKLHDWCYTPYGARIDVTQEEADLALREYIARDDILDAEIVYQSVHAFGGLYFGTSQTGYTGQQSSGPTPNIPIGPFYAKDVSMSIKVVMVLQQATVPNNSSPIIGYTAAAHIGGWTEHVWWPTDSLEDCLTALKGPALVNGQQPLLYARSLILSNQGTVLGVRLYQGGAGRGAFFPTGYNGSAGDEDIPQMALLCAGLGNGTPSVRRFTLRGIPDLQVRLGEFEPTTDYLSRMDLYLSSMTNFGFRGSNPVAKYAIASIAQVAGPPQSGLVTLTVNNPFSVSQFVTINQTLDAGQNRLGGRFMVSAIGPLNNQFSIAGWSDGATTGGTVSMPAKAVFQFLSSGGISVERVVTRRVGRPFGQYRGRRSKHRKIA
jgi:hypothetical protein